MPSGSFQIKEQQHKFLMHCNCWQKNHCEAIVYTNSNHSILLSDSPMSWSLRSLTVFFPGWCSVLLELSSLAALTEGYSGTLHENRHGSSAQIRRRKASGDPYWAYSGELTCSVRPVNIPLKSLQTTLRISHMPDFSLFKPFFTSLKVEILASVFLQGCKDLNFISPTCFFNLVSPPQFAFISELSLLMSYCTKLVIFQKHYLIHFELFSSCNFRKQKNTKQISSCQLSTKYYNALQYQNELLCSVRNADLFANQILLSWL